MSYISGKHQIFYVNSKNRDAGTNSNFSYKFNINPNIEFDRVCVLQALIPKSFYMIQNNQNTFTLTENSVDTTVTVPVGNYNRRSFSTVLVSTLNSASSQGWTYSITTPNTGSNADTGKYTYTVSGNGGLQPSFTFNGYIYEQMGFDDGSTNTFIGDTIESTNVIKLAKEDALFINSSISKTADGKYGILQEVYSNSGSSTFSNINWICPDVESYSKEFNGDGNSFFFSITDENFQEIDLNGQNLLLTIVLYKSQNIFELIKNYIKIKTIQIKNKI